MDKSGLMTNWKYEEDFSKTQMWHCFHWTSGSFLFVACLVNVKNTFQALCTGIITFLNQLLRSMYAKQQTFCWKQSPWLHAMWNLVVSMLLCPSVQRWRWGEDLVRCQRPVFLCGNMDSWLCKEVERLVFLRHFTQQAHHLYATWNRYVITSTSM